MRALPLLLVLLFAAACTSDSRATVQVRPRDASPAARAHGSVITSPSVLPSGTQSRVVCSTPHATGDFVETVLSGGVERSYRLHVPAALGGGERIPMVVNYHGYGRSAEDQERYSGLATVADREGFILVSPEGAGQPQEWQVVDVYEDSTTDDITFTADMVAQLEGELCIDPARIFATGISNGAEMASQVGCYLPNIFAAIAPVSGVVYQGCDGAPMPVISFHGTEDYNVPFESAPPAMADWASHNGCAADIEETRVSDHVTRDSYTGCGNNEAILYVIDGGGHTWPGAEDDAPGGGAGPTTHEINANDLIWQFFQQHPRN
jgi:polyhydroxybutyrate depolymerase